MPIDIEIVNAVKVLKEGGIILYPTDTIWGLGCDATNEKAVGKIFEIKKRTESKSLIILVSNDGMLNRYVKEVPEIAWELIDANNKEDDSSSKPITIIYDGARSLAKNAVAEDGSIGIRLIQDSLEETKHFCHKLIHKFGKPIVSTSANISNTPSPPTYSDISEEVISVVDYVVKLQTPNNNPKSPSSIIKLKANGEIKIIRE